MLPALYFTIAIFIRYSFEFAKIAKYYIYYIFSCKKFLKKMLFMTK